MEYTLSITDKRRKQMDHKEEIFDMLGKIRKRMNDLNEYVLLYQHQIKELSEYEFQQIKNVIAWLDHDMYRLNTIKVSISHMRGDEPTEETNTKLSNKSC